MKICIKVMILLVLFYYLSFSQNCQVTYDWPIRPHPEGKLITSTFGEYRPSTINPHFHEGIDIPEPQAENAKVWSLSRVFQVTQITTFSYFNHTIKIIHYCNDTSAALLEGSRYIHLTTVNEKLEVGEIYTWADTTYLSDSPEFEENHLHVELLRGFDLANSINPFTIPALRIDDYQAPIIDFVYVDHSLYGNANVQCWNFLKKSFSNYYDSVIGGGRKFIKLEIPAETPYDDWDDPHIIISGERKARFIVKTWDNATNEIVGPYKVELYVDLGIEDLSWEWGASPIYEVSFDSLINIGSSPDKYEEEDIYHVEQPIPSGWGTEKYYRLYPHDANGDGYPAPLIRKDLLRTENLEEGHHMIRVIVKDWNEIRKTGDFHIYIRRSEWVDYPRSF